MQSHFLFFYKKQRVVAKTACKNSHSVLRKVEKRTENGPNFHKTGLSHRQGRVIDSRTLGKNWWHFRNHRQSKR